MVFYAAAHTVYTALLFYITTYIFDIHAAEIKNENNKEHRLKMLMNFKLKVHNEYAKLKSKVP